MKPYLTFLESKAGVEIEVACADRLWKLQYETYEDAAEAAVSMGLIERGVADEAIAGRLQVPLWSTPVHTDVCWLEAAGFIEVGEL